jgi:hypothetical protein
MKTLLLFTAATALLGAQEFKFPVNLDRLAAKAKESVVVTLDANLLQLAGKFLSSKDAKEADVKKLVEGLKGIYVRSFEFDQPGQYTQADVESVRSQLKTPEWSRIVEVREKQGDNAEVYVRTENNQITGLTVIAAEPREFTVVNIAGPINPEDLARLGGQFGIPRMELKRGEKK